MLGRVHLLEQAIVNLVLNAVDAAPGGLVIVAAQPWAYEPRPAVPKRAAHPPDASFPRRPERRPAPTDFAAGAAGAPLSPGGFRPGGGPHPPAENLRPVSIPPRTGPG